MRWEFETFRKLYTRISSSWAALPVLARGLGSELLKYCDDEGRISLGSGETAADAVVRLTGAHRSEQKLVRSHVSALIADGYLVMSDDGGAVVVRNFEEAQEKLSSAARSARYRSRKPSRQSDAKRDTGGDESESPQSDAKRHYSDTDTDLPLTPQSGGLGSLRARGQNPRALGTNPRAQEDAPPTHLRLRPDAVVPPPAFPLPPTPKAAQ